MIEVATQIRVTINLSSTLRMHLITNHNVLTKVFVYELEMCVHSRFTFLFYCIFELLWYGLACD